MHNHTCPSSESNKFDNIYYPRPIQQSSPLVWTKYKFVKEIIGSQGKPSEHSPLKYLSSKKNK